MLHCQKTLAPHIVPDSLPVLVKTRLLWAILFAIVQFKLLIPFFFLTKRKTVGILNNRYIASDPYEYKHICSSPTWARRNHYKCFMLCVDIRRYVAGINMTKQARSSVQLVYSGLTIDFGKLNISVPKVVLWDRGTFWPLVTMRRVSFSKDFFSSLISNNFRLYSGLRFVFNLP